MLRENLSINVTPGGVPVIIHISQYDIGLRTFVFSPYTSHGTFTPDAAAAATLEGTKPDGNVIIHNCEYNASTGEITYTVQEQLAAVAGKVWSKLTLRDTSGNAIGYAAIIWMVDMAGVEDGAIASDSDISALQEFIAEFGTINAYKAALDGALAAVGGPYVASTVAQMTDHSKVYVYTGSQTGYTAGHWYYWNGSAWTDGGVYQAAAVETDKTLTVADMAADAKATGDAVAELKNEFVQTNGLTEITFTDGAYIATNTNTVDISVPVPSATWRYAVVSCNVGDTFIVNATGGAAPRAWAFIDSNGNVITRASASEIVAGVIKAPFRATNLIINDQAKTKPSYIGDYVCNTEESLSLRVDTTVTSDEIDEWVNNFYIPVNNPTVDFTPVARTGVRYAKIACNSGDVFTVTGVSGGGTGGRPWCFVTANGTSLLVCMANVTPTNQILIAPENSAWLILNDAGNGRVYRDIPTSVMVNMLNDEMQSVGRIEYIPLYQYGYIKLNVSTGTVVDVSPKVATGTYDGFRYAVVSCSPGDEYLISGTGITEARTYAFLDAEYKLINVVAAGTVTRQKIKAPNNSAYLVLNDNSGAYSYKILPESTDSAIAEYNYDNSNLEAQDFFADNADISDLLKTEKTKCVFHDNFARTDNVSEIGYNGSPYVDPPVLMEYGTLSNAAEGALQVGINNNRAVSTNNGAADANVTIKTVDAGGFPYKLIVACDDDGGVTNFYGSVALGIETVGKYINVTFNRNLISITPNSTTQISETVSVTHSSGVPVYEIYVYQDRIAVYNIGVKLIDTTVDMISTLCGIRFRAGNSINSGVTNPYALTCFAMFLPTEWLQNGFDRAWEDYTSIDVVQGSGQTEAQAIEARNNRVVKSLGQFQTGTTYGITFGTDNTVLSKRAVRFELRATDPQVSNGVRSEIVPIRPEGRELTLHTKLMDFDVYFGSDYDADRNSDLIMQMHDVPDGINLGALSPGIALVVYQDSLCITTQGKSTKVLTDADKPTVVRTVLCPLPKNQWTHITIFLREGYMSAHNPVVAVWLNDELTAVERGLNTYNEPYGSYIKFGIYKGWKSGATDVSQRVLLFDNVHFWF